MIEKIVRTPITIIAIKIFKITYTYNIDQFSKFKFAYHRPPVGSWRKRNPGTSWWSRHDRPGSTWRDRSWRIFRRASPRWYRNRDHPRKERPSGNFARLRNSSWKKFIDRLFVDPFFFTNGARNRGAGEDFFLLNRKNVLSSFNML